MFEPNLVDPGGRYSNSWQRLVTLCTVYSLMLASRLDRIALAGEPETRIDSWLQSLLLREGLPWVERLLHAVAHSGPVRVT